MKISKEWTDFERRVVAALITTECRNEAMAGRYPKGKFGNSETAAVVLCAPAWFLSETAAVVLCAPAWFLEQNRRSLERVVDNLIPEDGLNSCWERIARDIRVMFPSTNLQPPAEDIQ